MKFIFSDACICLCLRDSEISHLLAGERLDQDVRFGPAENQILRFRVVASQKIEAMQAILKSEEVRVILPQTILEKWALSPMRNFHFEQNAGNNRRLKITVQKEEDDSETQSFSGFSRPPVNRSQAFPEGTADHLA